ncbi:hypothetical protein CC2G_007989 [Coprinopsis cinerea AmutBmut pab1-1]|nr:hypothetical protein CC2G_007989 [Coprinopsis cinerea AmutBmut pab1-1]
MLYDAVDGKIKFLRNSSPDTFNPGDIIKMTFKVASVISKQYWWTELVPLQLVRMSTIPDYASLASSAPGEPEEEYMNILGVGQALDDIANQVTSTDFASGATKRKQEAGASPPPQEPFNADEQAVKEDSPEKKPVKRGKSKLN